MSDQIFMKPAAQRQLKKLTSAIQKDLIALIESLSEEPRPLGCKKLKHRQNQYRVRSGDYRIIYSIEDLSLTVRVIKVRTFPAKDLPDLDFLECERLARVGSRARRECKAHAMRTH